MIGCGLVLCEGLSWDFSVFTQPCIELLLNSRCKILKQMSTMELKSEIEQWLAKLPADKLEQVLAYVSFISQWSTSKPNITAMGQTKTSVDQQRADFRRHCGAIRSGLSNSADNNAIDADLAASYAS